MSTSSKTKTTTRQSVGRKTSAAKTASTKKKVATKEIASATEAPESLDLRKPALIEAVVRRSGVKKKDAKPVIEAMLAELGETLAAGRNLSLEPFGKAKVVREKEIQNGRMLVLRLRQKDRVTATLPTATAAE